MGEATSPPADGHEGSGETSTSTLDLLLDSSSLPSQPVPSPRTAPAPVEVASVVALPTADADEASFYPLGGAEVAQVPYEFTLDAQPVRTEVPGSTEMDLDQQERWIEKLYHKIVKMIQRIDFDQPYIILIQTATVNQLVKNICFDRYMELPCQDLAMVVDISDDESPVALDREALQRQLASVLDQISILKGGHLDLNTFACMHQI